MSGRLTVKDCVPGFIALWMEQNVHRHKVRFPDTCRYAECYPRRMRVLINYATYAEKVSIHCLADDARTVVAPFKRVASLETLYRLIKYVGGDPAQCRREMKKWGHGGCWADVKPEHYDLLGIRKMPQSLGAKSGRSLAE